MSQKHHAPRSASRSPFDDGRRITLPPVKPRDDYQRRTDLLEWQLSVSGQRLRDPQLQSIANRYFRPKAYGAERDLGVHSILNPDVSTNIQNPVRIQSESSESIMLNPNSRLNTSSQHIYSSHQSPTSGSLSATDNNSGSLPWMTRPMLTPKSPSRVIHSSRAATSGTLDAEGSTPFMGPSNQIQTLEPSLATSLENSLNSGPSIAVQPNPTQRFSKNYPKSNHVGIPTNLNLQSVSSVPLSKIPSPSASTTSSYNPPTAQNSPVSLIHQGGQASPSNPYYSSGSSLGSSMQLVGGIQGPLGNLEGLYTIPVDVHHASRLANEKRARNAGASARFRQRRKEKEKEANLAIEKLQSQVKDLERNLDRLQTERDFYRSERDRLRDVMLRTPETRYIAMQTPRSPPERQRNFSEQLDIFSGSQQNLTGQHDIMPEENSNKKRGEIRDNFTEASFVISSISQPEPKVSTGYSMTEMIQNSQHLYPSTSLSSSQSKLNNILTTSESPDSLRKSFNTS